MSDKLQALSFLCFLVADLCLTASASAGVCHFEYTTKVQNHLILPVLKEDFGEAYVYFDYEKPVIVIKPRLVTIQLAATKTIKGRRLAFEDLVFVEIDSCGSRMLRYYTSGQYHKN